MIFAHPRHVFSAVAFAMAVALTPVGAQAQEISASHMKAARDAITAIRATEQFDLILPQAAQALKVELIQKDPNLQSVINATVDEKTLAMVGRRADLEREAASAYAKVFTEQQLNEIAAFYNSEAGKKLLADGPIVTREVIRAVEIWQTGVARDLAQAVAEQIAAVAGKSQPAANAATPVITPETGGTAEAPANQ